MKIFKRKNAEVAEAEVIDINKEDTEDMKDEKTGIGKIIAGVVVGTVAVGGTIAAYLRSKKKGYSEIDPADDDEEYYEDEEEASGDLEENEKEEEEVE